MEWKDVTNYFTEEQRHYKNTYGISLPNDLFFNMDKLLGYK